MKWFEFGSLRESKPEVPDLAPHEIERAVIAKLQNHPSLRFARLQVHQCGRDEVCLEGFLDSNEQAIDLCEVVRGIHGIRHVSNHVIVGCRTPSGDVSKAGLSIEITIPDDASDEEIEAATVDAAKLADELHRAYGGHGLKVDEISASGTVLVREVSNV